MVHYGVFHIGYAVFLTVFSSGFIPFFSKFTEGTPIDFTGILLMGAIFLVGHAYSYYYNFILRNEREVDGKGLSRIFSYPYVRIIPMHVTIILGAGFILKLGGGLAVLIFFLAIKTLADLGMHVREHKTQ
jgi:uncharacterized membrane protein